MHSANSNQVQPPRLAATEKHVSTTHQSTSWPSNRITSNYQQLVSPHKVTSKTSNLGRHLLRISYCRCIASTLISDLLPVCPSSERHVRCDLLAVPSNACAVQLAARVRAIVTTNQRDQNTSWHYGTKVSGIMRTRTIRVIRIRASMTINSFRYCICPCCPVSVHVSYIGHPA